ncbi:MAG: RNA 2',3'-cyclic phosphodiesterase [Candidatus Acidiferrales bacterium]
MRLFVALDVPEETRRALHAVIEGLSVICCGARWVRPEGVHITLKFIGHVEDTKLPGIQEALSLVRGGKAVDMAFQQFGFFPHEKRPRIFYIRIEAAKELGALAGEIETRLEPAGIAKEARSFQPHLTLARFKSNEGLPELRKKIASLPSQDFGGGTAAEFHLYQSVLQSGGAVYSKLSTYRFVK